MRGAAVALDTETAWPEDAVEVGRIVDAWGVKGWLKVQPFAADPQALFSSRRWFVKPAQDRSSGRTGKPGATTIGCLKIIAAKEHGDSIVAQAQGIADRAEAETLRGARIFVGRSSFPTADVGEFYWVDLIGLEVFNRQAESLGTVVGLIDTGPQSVLRVLPSGTPDDKGSPDAERLIPFVNAYVDDVNLRERRIVVDWALDY
jgi:16S rRNA processing protein RimM